MVSASCSAREHVQEALRFVFYHKFSVRRLALVDGQDVYFLLSEWNTSAQILLHFQPWCVGVSDVSGVSGQCQANVRPVSADTSVGSVGVSGSVSG